MKSTISILVILMSCAEIRANRELALTVYNQDFAVIKDTRNFQVPKETGQLTFTDVAARIDPTSVQITNLTNPKFTVAEQNFENNLVSSEKLLGKMIDQPVTVLLDDGKTFTGQLLSAENSTITLQTNEGVKVIERNKNFDQILLSKLPQGLLLRPALVWKVKNSTGENEKIEIAYQTAGFNWSADYNVLLRPEKQTLDMNGWVTVNNTCGSGFPDAHLKLVAGEVHKVQPPQIQEERMMMRKSMVMAEAAAPPPGFQERAFAEYHLYDLGRKTTLENNETKQIELFDIRDINYATEFLFAQPDFGYYSEEYSQSQTGEGNLTPLKIVATIENKKENQLGIPLPAGNVRMYQEDREKVDHFIGQDHIDHTPKDEKLRLTVGQAFDVVGSKKMVATNRISDTVSTQDILIRIRNHKDSPVPVVVLEKLMEQMNWKIEQPSDKFRKVDYRTIEFKVTLPANSEKNIHYRVRYEMYRW
ncbi:MAG: DUF4139 domain-containing protein [Phycisphaerae bacterium]